MTHSNSSNDLLKYKEIVCAGIDYYINIYSVLLEYDEHEQSKLLYSDFIKHYEGLKINATELYTNKKLSTLRKWFNDISEQAIATRDLNYQKHIEKVTGHHIDIFANFFLRIDKIIQIGFITTTIQYRDIVAMIDYLSEHSSNADKVIVLDKMIFDYSEKKRSKTKKNKSTP